MSLLIHTVNMVLFSDLPEGAREGLAERLEDNFTWADADYSLVRKSVVVQMLNELIADRTSYRYFADEPEVKSEVEAYRECLRLLAPVSEDTFVALAG